MARMVSHRVLKLGLIEGAGGHDTLAPDTYDNALTYKKLKAGKHNLKKKVITIHRFHYE
jgi:hypothetical protein